MLPGLTEVSTTAVIITLSALESTLRLQNHSTAAQKVIITYHSLKEDRTPQIQNDSVAMRLNVDHEAGFQSRAGRIYVAGRALALNVLRFLLQI